MNKVNSFLDYLALNKRFSVNTVKSYRTDLFQFSNYLTNNYPETNIEEAGATQIRSWMVDILEQGVNSRSVRRKITSLKSFYNYLLLQGEAGHNPVEALSSPKFKTPLPQYINITDINTLFDKLDFPDDFKGNRSKLIIETFYSTGIRLAELISVKHSDINIIDGTIKVTGKGNKQRIIPLIPNLVTTLNNYVESKKELFPCNSDNYLLVTNKGNKLYPKFIYREVFQQLSFVTTLDKKSPHVLRHTFATHMLNNGAELNSIKELLGHASLSATQVYTHNSVEKLKKVYKQAHPKA